MSDIITGSLAEAFSNNLLETDNLKLRHIGIVISTPTCEYADWGINSSSLIGDKILGYTTYIQPFQSVFLIIYQVLLWPF